MSKSKFRIVYGFFAVVLSLVVTITIVSFFMRGNVKKLKAATEHAAVAHVQKPAPTRTPTPAHPHPRAKTVTPVQYGLRLAKEFNIASSSTKITAIHGCVKKGRVYRCVFQLANQKGPYDCEGVQFTVVKDDGKRTVFRIDAKASRVFKVGSC